MSILLFWVLIVGIVAVPVWLALPHLRAKFKS
jgi:hypothetical protein